MFSPTYIAKVGLQIVSCEPAISIFLYLRRPMALKSITTCLGKRFLNVSLRSKRFRTSYCSFSLLSNVRVKLARKRLLRRLLKCCPTIPSMISCIVHHSRVSLVFPRSPSPNTGDLPSRGPSPLFSRDGTGRESSLSTRKEKVLITCVGILYSPIIMQSVEGQACPDATHFLMAGTQVCDPTYT